MIRQTFTTLIICFFTLNAFSQIEAITEKGDTISVYDNGTWKNTTIVKKTFLIESSVNATVDIDDFTNKKSVKTDTWNSFGDSSTKTKLSGYTSFYNEGIYSVTLMLPSNLGCMSKQRSTLIVKLSNNEFINFIQVSDTDCGDAVYATFIPISEADLKNENFKNVIKENVEILKEFDWVTMRIQGTKFYTDITPRVTNNTPKPEQFFRQHILSIKNNL